MRRVDPSDRRSLFLSIVLHASVLGVVWLSMIRSDTSIEFIAYEIDLVSPPPAVEAEEYTPAREELVVERPQPEPPPPEPEPPAPRPQQQTTIAEPEPQPQPPAPEPEPAPPDPTPTPTPPPPEPEPTPDPTPAAGPDAVPNADRSGENLTVRMAGLRRDYPEYYNNIIRQIQRCFRPPEGNWVTTLTFKIRRDGSVNDIQFAQRSGNTAYDYVAMEAVECAGQPGRLGQLPEDLPADFPVQFEIRRTR